MDDQTLTAGTGVAVRVLIVEDSPLQARQLKDLLAAHGFEVDEARHGVEALALLAVQRPSLVISDILMPAMDGYELCRRIRADPRLADLPVLLLTSLTNTTDMLEGLACGADSFVTKPYEEDHLLAQVSRMLSDGQRRAGAGSAVAMDIAWDGRTHVVNVDNRRMVTLLFSAYDAAVRKNQELLRAQDELRSLNELLTVQMVERAAARTAELASHTQTETALRDIEEQRQIQYGTYRDALMMLSPPSWDFASCNKAALWMFQVQNQDELIALGTAAISPENQPDGSNSAEKARSMIETALHTGSHYFEWTHRRAGGQTFPAEVLLSRVDQGGQAMLQVTMRDITERKQMEEQLARLSRHHELILASAGEGILGLNAEGSHTFVNPAAARMLGYESKELLGRHSHELWHHTRADGSAYPKEECQIYAAMRDGVVHHSSTEIFWRKNGTSFPAEYTSTPILEQERLVGAVVTFADITDRVLAKKALKRLYDDLSRHNTELLGFYHTISHELKTPLTSAREFVSIMLDGIAGPLTDDQKLYLHLIRESCDQLGFCINDLTDASQLETGKLEIHAVDTPVERLVAGVVSVMTPVMHAKGIELSYEIDPAVSTAAIEERRFNQVCMNLLSNAQKYTPPGGVVTVQVCVDPQDPKLIRFSVRDSGSGIAAGHLERVFDKLFQVRKTDTAIEGGLGLGLYISSRIVRLHGGRMWAESTVGVGSVFHFTLLRRASTPRHHILYVGHEVTLQGTVQTLLEKAGYGVSVASDGATALEIARDQTPDLAIVDLCLPGMPGPVLMKELRKRWSDLPLIVHTAYPGNQLMAEALESEPLTVLKKPCADQELLSKVRALLLSGSLALGGRPEREPGAAA